VRERKLQVAADHLFVVGFEHWRVQEACNPGYVIVREHICGVLIEESGGDQNLELLVPVELQDAADTVQDLAADASLARFEAAKRAAVDPGQVSNLLLR
jgi:hypothetical protein